MASAPARIFGIVVSGEIDEWGIAAVSYEPPAELDARHTAELDVEQEAVEPRMLAIRQERLCRRIRDRLDSRRTQQPAERSGKILVVIDDGDVEGFGVAHEAPMSTIGVSGRVGYCPLGKVGVCPGVPGVQGSKSSTDGDEMAARTAARAVAETA